MILILHCIVLFYCTYSTVSASLRFALPGFTSLRSASPVILNIKIPSSARNDGIPILLILRCRCVLLVELLDTSICAGSLLLTCIELMALRADLDTDLRYGGSHRKSIAAMACNLCLIVLWLNICFHLFCPFLRRRFPTSGFKSYRYICPSYKTSDVNIIIQQDKIQVFNKI